MKKFGNLIMSMMVCCVMSACTVQPYNEPGGADGDVNSKEQAEIIAAALSTDQGGVGKDIENIAKPSTRKSISRSGLSLSVSAEMSYYDTNDQPQSDYNSQTTDHIGYESQIQGELSTGSRYFQKLSIDNRSNFVAAELLSGTAVIDGTHTNHSAYERSQTLNNTEVQFNLECEMSVEGVTVDLNAGDTFPEDGIIEGTVSGTYERTSSFDTVSKTFYFHFTATYQGDNTAEIALNDGSLFTVNLKTGKVYQMN